MAILVATIAVIAVLPAMGVAAPTVETIGGTLSTNDGLHQGDRGLRVAELQQLLAAIGYTVNVDGVYGPQTARAVKHWERANGIGKSTGAFANPDMVQLLRSVASVREAPAPVSTLPTVGTGADAETIIRAVWPPELADHAVAIAMRESRLQPGVRNACCWGLFQIHWQAHRAWLATIGITSPAQLLDAATNARAAYALWQRNGWAPWSL